jgi:hypothetical protein
MKVIQFTVGPDEILEDLSDRQAVLHLFERLVYDHKLTDLTVKVKELPDSEFHALDEIPEFNLPKKHSLVDDL